jgi:hypothetical protein
MKDVTRCHRFCRALVAIALLLAPAQLLAQTPPGTAAPGAAAPGAAPPGGINLPGSSGQTCVQIAVSGEKPSPYNCLNQELQQQVEGTNPISPKLPLSATSPSNQVGTFNEQSVSEQYGKNFGKSVIPYRPPPPVFGSGISLPH